MADGLGNKIAFKRCCLNERWELLNRVGLKTCHKRGYLKNKVLSLVIQAGMKVATLQKYITGYVNVLSAMIARCKYTYMYRVFLGYTGDFIRIFFFKKIEHNLTQKTHLIRSRMRRFIFRQSF